MLLVLQYSIAAVHGFTVYLLSVVLSIAQLIMITATIENLDWIQTYKPLMREWDSRFPGFVFPAQDIDSESDDDMEPYEEDYSSSSSQRRRLAKRYNSHALPLKGDDDDGYHSEESQKRIGASMNSILRQRLAKCQQWMPSLWSAEENSVTGEQEQKEDGAEEMQDEDSSINSQDRYSTRIRKALVRTLSGNIKTSKSKRVTFNEQVLILGRRLSRDTSQSATKSSPIASVPPMTPISVLDKNASTDISSALVAGSIDKVNGGSPESTHRTLSSTEIEALAQEESSYQKSIANQDTNGSGTSSPAFHPSPDLSTVSSPELSPPSTSSQGSSICKDLPDLRRATSVPHKIGSFFGRHQNHGSNNNANAPQQNTITRHSATFSESSTVAQNPRTATIHVTLPSYPATGPSTGSSAAVVPHQQLSSAESTPRSSMSLGTRAKRSFSLALPRPTSTISVNTSTDASSNAGSVERQGSIGRKNKNFIYRIVHPQRYKRELEQQLTEQERQRLLALAQLQRHQLLAAESSADMAGATNHLCGDAYFYATSAEYIDDLGAPNSVISTSIGTSFPAELQGKKPPKNHTKQRPASYDYGYRPAVLFPGACGYSSESDSALEGSATEETNPQVQKPQSRSQSFLFKRDGKKNLTLGKTTLQQMFSHPGHKQTQSTSSLIVPPGADTCSTSAGLSSDIAFSDGSLPPPGFSSSAAAGAHRLLAHGRSNSRTFTSFTAMGTPAFPPAQPALPSSLMTCPKNNTSVYSGTSDHTSFADFGFPSPTLSPVEFVPSTSSSPRHSTSSAPDMIYSSMVYYHEQQEVLSDQQSLDSDDTFYGVPEQTEQPQQLQEMQPVGAKSAIEVEPLTPGTSRESSMTLSSNGSVTKETRSMSFMRKLSLRKKN
ncbi:hypothetical protein BG003_004172 [Podila horticola]|nr:hypothetical protein BG003_004172 [Podila horticola]